MSSPSTSPTMKASGCLYGFTTPGQKVEWMRANPLVCVEVKQGAAHRAAKHRRLGRGRHGLNARATQTRCRLPARTAPNWCWWGMPSSLGRWAAAALFAKPANAMAA